MIYALFPPLLVETGFFCDITEKALQEYMHKRRGIVARFTAAKRRTISRYRVSHPYEVAYLCLAAEEASLCGLRPALVPVRPRRTKTKNCKASLCLISPCVHPPLRLDGTQATSSTAQSFD